MLRAIYHDSIEKIDGNLLILLHGFGDTCDNFIKFGIKMQLPQTKLCAIQAPVSVIGVPDVKGWFLKFNEFGDELDIQDERVQVGIHEIVAKLSKFIDDLVANGWNRSRIFLLGFSQGGQVALKLAEKVGGVVSIGGFFLEKPKSIENILTTVGSRDENINLFDSSMKCVHVISEKGHEMPKTRQEMSLIMEFFAKRLFLRNLALENSPGIIQLQ